MIIDKLTNLQVVKELIDDNYYSNIAMAIKNNCKEVVYSNQFF